MDSTIRVDFHCHSKLSDGFYAPEELVPRLVDEGVRYTSLTDHDCFGGFEHFELELERHGINGIAGVEITVAGDEEPLHILAFGFDRDNDELLQLLASRRTRREQSSMDWALERLRAASPTVPSLPEESTEWPQAVQKVVDIVHGANGCAFLAHPMALTAAPEELDGLFAAFKAVGLDGVEALYTAYSEAEQQTLVALADKHELVVCAGSDFHGPQLPGPKAPGIDMPVARWKAFRNAVMSRGLPARPPAGPAPDIVEKTSAPPHLSRFLVRVLVPALLIIGLYMASLFAVIVPAFQESLLEQKQEMIRELTNSAWSILAEYEAVLG